MTLGTCNHERELAAALHEGYWPDACSPELRTHVEACRTCSERLLVTTAFRRERAVAAGSARLESPGVIWWRAQLRRRNAAIERISRPIFGAQVFAVAVALVAAAVFFASQAKQSVGWLAWIADIPRSLHLEALLPASLQGSAGIIAAVLVTIAAIALVGGAAMYNSSERR